MLEFQTPLINILFHLISFLVGVVSFIIGIGLWHNRNVNHLGVSSYWRIFITGVLFYTISEFSDIFTPVLHSSLGVHHLITEMSLLVGLSLIFVSLYRFIHDYIQKTPQGKQTSQEQKPTR